MTDTIDVNELPDNLEELSAQQVCGILEELIEQGVQPEEITLGFCESSGNIAVAVSGIVMGTIKRFYDGLSVTCKFTPRSMN